MFRRAALLAALAGAIAAAASAAPALRGQEGASNRAADASGVPDLTARLAELKAVQASSVRTIGDRRARLAALNAKEAALNTQMGANQTSLARLLGALELYRRNPPPALLVTPQSALDAVRGAILARAVTPELARRAAAYRAQALELARVRRAVDALSEDIFTSESALAEARAEAERVLAARAAGQAQGGDPLGSGLRTLGGAGAASARMPAAPKDAPSSLRLPVSGTLVRRFGRASPNGLRSLGEAFSADPGAYVRAPAAGVVEYAGAVKGWGAVVILGVGGDLHVVLAGIDELATAPGRLVDAGQLLGRLAPRAAAKPELYLEVRKGGAPQDPSRWLRPTQSLGPAR